MTEKTTIETVIKNIPFALFLIGVFLVLTGAAGGWPSLSLEVGALGWQITLAVLGLVTVSMGGLLIFRERVPQQTPKKTASNKFGIEITSHDHETDVAEVQGAFQLSGTYDPTIPPENMLQVFVRYKDTYHPASPGGCTTENGRWRAEIGLGGDLGPRLLVVAVIGQL